MTSYAYHHPDRQHIVTPDWVTESVTMGESSPQPESIYHPRLLLDEKPAALAGGDGVGSDESAVAMDTSELDMSGVAPLDGKVREGELACFFFLD